MKKVIYLLELCMVLGLAGCGNLQKNEKSVSENEDNHDTIQNEQTADIGVYPPCVMVDGVIYKDTGYVASIPGCGTMDGEIVSTVAGTELPAENNQSNFGSGYEYQISSEGKIIVVIDGKLLVTHMSTAEGFQMNDGEYYVSTENLAEDVQVGDIVTIWFNGMIQETDPAQLCVVYRIIKTK